jgi:tetratricopeptide (TPR) repeat protein
MRLSNFIFFILLCIPTFCVAQKKVSIVPQACLYYNNGIAYLKQRDFEAAIAEFREAVAVDKKNMVLNREYAFAYFLNKKNGLASVIIDETMLLKDADETVYKLACEIYTAKNDFKTAENVIEIGMEKFPISGILVAQKAELYYAFNKDAEAIDLWQRAMDMQPGFADPYYGIAKANDTAITPIGKTILYAESFILTEPYSVKSVEMKKLLYRCYQVLYKELFTKNKEPHATVKRNYNNGAEIENVFLRIVRSNKYILMDGASLDNISKLRKRCIEDWQASQAEGTMPSVMEYHQRLMHEQLFEAYNQWLLGSVANANQYKDWAMRNDETMNLLNRFLKENKYIIR